VPYISTLTRFVKRWGALSNPPVLRANPVQSPGNSSIIYHTDARHSEYANSPGSQRAPLDTHTLLAAGRWLHRRGGWLNIRPTRRPPPYNYMRSRIPKPGFPISTRRDCGEDSPLPPVEYLGRIRLRTSEETPPRLLRLPYLIHHQQESPVP